MEAYRNNDEFTKEIAPTAEVEGAGVPMPEDEFGDEDEDMIPFAEAEDRLATLEARLNEAEALLVTQDGQFEEAFSDLDQLESRVDNASHDYPYLKGRLDVLSRQITGLYIGIGACAMLWLMTAINTMHK
jgi:tetrahydromethanopterin S-methyltransferase subunit G